MKQPVFAPSPLGGKDHPAVLAGKSVSPAAWTVWVLAVFLAACVLGWSFLGTVTRTVEITGVVFPENGIEPLKSGVSGQIRYLPVEVGDNVVVGELIAIVDQQEILRQIEAEKAAEQPDEAKLQALFEEYQAKSMVYSPFSGRIVELAAVGAVVQPGDGIAGIAGSGGNAFDVAYNQAEIRAYIPTTVAQDLKKGMRVLVCPQFDGENQYGSIEGLVGEISAYPITETDIQESLGRFSPGKLPDGSENITEVRVTLVGGDGSALRWTRTGGKDLNVDIGTLVSMKVVLSEENPWQSWLKR